MPSTYPAIRQSRDSKETRSTGRQLERATNGKPRVRVLWSASRKMFYVKHPGITVAEKATLQTFIAAEALTSFFFVWNGDGATYTCLLSDKDPEFVPLPGNRWDVMVDLVEA